MALVQTSSANLLAAVFRVKGYGYLIVVNIIAFGIRAPSTTTLGLRVCRRTELIGGTCIIMFAIGAARDFSGIVRHRLSDRLLSSIVS